MERITINFDMDGTIANLYGVENWLDKLRAEDPTPYAEAKPLLRLNTLARMLNRLQRQGYNLAIISWLAKGGSDDYMEAIRQAKKEWLRKHLSSVQWDRITIISYGTPKERYCETADDILFDDERGNREAWNGKAFDVNNIIETLKELSGK
jgi:phosphoglycolate phosphatase-like HAD superfamily hydrolase